MLKLSAASLKTFLCGLESWVCISALTLFLLKKMFILFESKYKYGAYIYKKIIRKKGVNFTRWFKPEFVW